MNFRDAGFSRVSRKNYVDIAAPDEFMVERLPAHSIQFGEFAMGCQAASGER
jgi:hypothetical protein